jgi:hypothetical protein
MIYSLRSLALTDIQMSAKLFNAQSPEFTDISASMEGQKFKHYDQV